MAAVLDGVRPLAGLLAQAGDPVAVAEGLSEAALAGATGEALTASVGGGDRRAAGGRDAACQRRARRRRAPDAGRGRDLRAGREAEAEAGSGFRLVVTVPEFLRGALGHLLGAVGEGARPLDTTLALRQTAAGPRLQIAAPLLHVGFVGLLAPQVERSWPAAGRCSC